MEFSAGYLFASLSVSAIGFGFFQYGRKQRRAPQMLTGFALMIFPYFLGDPAAILGIAAAAVVALWLLVRVGL